MLRILCCSIFAILIAINYQLHNFIYCFLLLAALLTISFSTSNVYILVISWLSIILFFIYTIFVIEQKNSSLLNVKTGNYSVTGCIKNIPVLDFKRRYHFLLQIHKSNISLSTKKIFIQAIWRPKIPMIVQQSECYYFRMHLWPLPPLRTQNLYQRQQFWQGISATAYVLYGKKLSTDLTQNWLQYWRQKIYLQLNILVQYKKYKQYLGILFTLVLGLKKTVYPAQWQIFRQTGTTHLMAISGLHLTLILMLWRKLLIYIIRYMISFMNEKILLYLPLPYIIDSLLLIISIEYYFFSGAALPTQRATLILSLTILLHSFGKRVIHTVSIIYLSIFIIIFINPLAIIMPSFWLSYYAYGSLLYISRLFHQNFLQKWQFILLPSLMFVILLPLNILFFQQISWSAIPANLIAIPFVSYIILPLSFCIVMMLNFSSILSSYLLQLNLYLIHYLLQYLSYLASILNSWQLKNTYNFNLLLLFLSVFYILLPAKFPGKLTASLLFLLSLFIMK